LPNPWQRWKDAADLAKVDRNERHGKDADVVAAADYLDALARCTTDDEQAEVRERWPEISQASDIFVADSLERWELEGHILAGASDDDIAQRVGLSPRTIATYASLFCAMRDFVDEPEWLATKLFGYPLALYFRENQLREFWAWIGICGGPVMVSRFVSDFRATWQPGTPPLLSVYLRADAPVSLSLQAFVAIKLLPGNAKTVPILFETHLGLIEAERETDPARKKEKLDQLKRTMIEFTRGYLAGKTAEELLQLLRYPPSLERVTAKMRELAGAVCFELPKGKSPDGTLVGLPELAGPTLRENGAC
jgi:hypothetical protein